MGYGVQRVMGVKYVDVTGNPMGMGMGLVNDHIGLVDGSSGPSAVTAVPGANEPQTFAVPCRQSTAVLRGCKHSNQGITPQNGS
jgi:hypothetical protein